MFLVACVYNHVCLLETLQGNRYRYRRETFGIDGRWLCEITPLSSPGGSTLQRGTERGLPLPCPAPVVFLYYPSTIFKRLTRVRNGRRNFGEYARRAVRRLARNMKQTSSSLQSSKWLAGARVVYEAVRARRHAVGKETKSFADWIGLQHYSSTIDIGMSGHVTSTFSSPDILASSSFFITPNGSTKTQSTQQ